MGALEEPDPIGTVLAHVLRFLKWLCYNHNVREAEQHSYGMFWDYASLHQKPRSTAEGQAFGQALKVMAGLYASPFGSCVMQHRLMPPRPPELDGVVLMFDLSPAPASVDAVRQTLPDLAIVNVARRSDAC